MSERLLTVDQVEDRLGFKRTTIYNNLPKLIAKGLVRVPFSTRSVRFTESSLEKLIKRAADRTEPLF